MTLTNVTVTDNSADIGGGINNDNTLTLNSSTLQFNSARTQEGGLDNWSGTATLTNSQVMQNDAPTGGGIFERAGEVTLSSTRVKENSPNNCAPLDSIAGCTG